MKITVSLTVSQETNNLTFDLEDLNLTQDDWNNLNESERESAIQKIVDDLPEQPYWVVDTFTEN